jgi:hypothetical protein
MGSLLQSKYRISQTAGIAVHTNDDGSFAIAACLMEAQKDSVIIEKKIASAESVGNVCKNLPRGVAIGLCLTGKGILTRQIELVDGSISEKLKMVFPNLNAGEFYIQEFVSGKSCFLSLIRREQADNWIAALRAAGFATLGLSLGPFAVRNIDEQLNFYDEEFRFNGHHIVRDKQGDWLSWSFQTSFVAQHVIKAENETLPEAMVLPYAAAFQLALYPALSMVRADVPACDRTLADELRLRKIRVNSVLFIVIIFLLLVINITAFLWLRSRNEALSAQLSNSRQNTTDAVLLTQQVSGAERLLDEFGWDAAGSKAAMLADVARLMPVDIQWSRAEVNPVDAPVSRSAHKTVFLKRAILISGTCKAILPVNEWLARISTLHWVTESKLNAYRFDNEKDTGVFTIKISY